MYNFEFRTDQVDVLFEKTHILLLSIQGNKSEIESLRTRISGVLAQSKVIDGIICPFCDTTGFDKIGLKYHLDKCKGFDKV